MKLLRILTATLFLVISTLSEGYAQCSYCDCGSYVTDGDENTTCIQGSCCTVWNACNGPYSACHNYDPDYSETGGCDLSCAPIDSGVLFLLLGGAAFGGAMIARNRRRELQLKSERV